MRTGVRRVDTSKPAIHGGPKAKRTPCGSGRRFAGNEMLYLKKALDSNTLFYASGTFVKRACEMMKKYTGRRYAVACTSGSAAVHLGCIAAGIGPGDEVIMTPHTDYGSALGVIEEGAVPVFCDYDENLQPTVETVAARVTPRTKAVLVIHLAGYPAPAGEIAEWCSKRGIAVIEDCAQAWGTRLKGRRAGSFGLAACFSTNDFKHISTGDGGFVVLDDPDLYRRVSNYADKYYDRFFDRSLNQAHHGMNYRMSELQGAVACAQLERVNEITRRYHALGARLERRLKGLKGGRMMQALPGGYSTYWWTLVEVDPSVMNAGRDEIVSALQAEGINAVSFGRYDLIQNRLFQERVVRPWLADDRRFYPLVQPDGRSYTYSVDQTPVHRRILHNGIQIAMNRFYTETDIDEIAEAILKVFRAFC